MTGLIKTAWRVNNSETSWLRVEHKTNCVEIAGRAQYMLICKLLRRSGLPSHKNLVRQFKLRESDWFKLLQSASSSSCELKTTFV